MRDREHPTVVVLDTGLFPDREGMETALRLLVDRCVIKRFDLRGEEQATTDWDRLVADIRSASKVITV